MFHSLLAAVAIAGSVLWGVIHPGATGHQPPMGSSTPTEQHIGTSTETMQYDHIIAGPGPHFATTTHMMGSTTPPRMHIGDGDMGMGSTSMDDMHGMHMGTDTDMKMGSSTPPPPAPPRSIWQRIFGL